MTQEDRLAGCLLATAIGDAIGLVTEGMSPRAIERRFGELRSYKFCGKVGFVSDDTQQSALVAQSLCASDSLEDFRNRFRRSLLGWFLRLPWGIGYATLRACVRIGVGLTESGVYSAGNGAAMRAAIVGVFFHDDSQRREQYGLALARVTHTDPRAVEGALTVSEIAARCVKGDSTSNRLKIVEDSLNLLTEPGLREATNRALVLAQKGEDRNRAAKELGTTGFIQHTLPFAVFLFIRYGSDPLECFNQTATAGGDTDSIGAIVGAWVGALHGSNSLPESLVNNLQGGPFGEEHLRRLASGLHERRKGGPAIKIRFFWPYEVFRNMILFPVALFQGIRAATGL